MPKRNEPVGFVPWNTPPELQGQMIELSYGTDAEGERWERRHDRSGPETTYRHLGHATDDLGEWQPWNRQPPCAGGR